MGSTPYAAELIMDGQSFGRGNISFPGNDTCLVLTNAPFAETTFLDTARYHGPYTTTFTMTGHSPLGGPDGVDLAGQGTLTLGTVLSFGGGIFANWTFKDPRGVPEPATVALLDVGLTIVAVTRRKFAGR